MRNIVLLILLLAAVAAIGCGPSKREIERKLKAERLLDSIMFEREKLKVDTSTAYFRRVVWADKKHMLTFDRIEILTGEEAEEYASQRHGFDGSKPIVVNLEKTTATMSVLEDADIWILNPAYKTDKSKNEYIKGGITDVENFEFNTILKIKYQNKEIFYLKQLSLEK